MELLYTFSILWRMKWKLLAGGLIGALLFAGNAIFLEQDTYKTTIILQTTTKVTESTGSEINPLAFFEAADRFSEAMLGWFRNPIVFDELAENVDGLSGGDIANIFTIRRQEKQNLNIGYSTKEESLAEDLSTTIIAYLKDRVEQINTESNSSYDLVNITSKIETITPSTSKAGALGFALGLVVAFALFLTLEIAKGRVLYKEQGEKAVGSTSIAPIEKGDHTYIASLLGKKTGLHIWIAPKGANLTTLRQILKEAANENASSYEDWTATKGKKAPKDGILLCFGEDAYTLMHTCSSWNEVLVHGYSTLKHLRQVRSLAPETLRIFSYHA